MDKIDGEISDANLPIGDDGGEQVIDIRQTPNWGCGLQQQLSRLKDPIEESKRWSKQSIYRIPNSLAALNVKAYKPEILSIGPYHHGDGSFKIMEEHKRRALAMFLKRWKTNVPKLCEILAPKVQDLKDAYDQLEDKWKDDDNAFLEVMVLDGCFILELLHIHGQTATRDGEGYPDNDPIFSCHGKLYMVPHLISDMLMLENQLPLRNADKSTDESFSVAENAIPLTKRIVRMIQGEELADEEAKRLEKCLHILDIHREILFLPYHNSYKMQMGCFSANRFIGVCGKDGGEYIIRSATELKAAGIKINGRKSKSWKDISFKAGLCCGVLELPEITVDGGFEPFIRNMMAYERLHNGTGNDVTFFISFIDSLIDNTDDVVLLHSRGVLKNALGSDKALVNVINSLSIQSTLDPNHLPLLKVQRQVSAFCKKRKLPSWREVFMHNYCRHPLLAVTVTVGILIFSLTILQTLYTVISYVIPRRQLAMYVVLFHSAICL